MPLLPRRIDKFKGYPQGLRRIGGEAFWVAFGVFFSTLGTFAGVRLLTTFLAPEEYGKLSLAVSLAMGFLYSVGRAIQDSIIRYYHIGGMEGGAPWYWRTILRIVLIVGSLAFVFFLITVFAFLWHENETLYFLGLIGLFGGLLIINSIGDALHTAARNRKIFCLHKNLFGWGQFAIAALLVLFWRMDAVAALVGFVVTTLLVIGSQYYWLKKNIPRAFLKDQASGDRTAQFVRYLWPLMLGGSLAWVQQVADRWSLNTFSSLADVGIYAALYQISFSPMLYLSLFMVNLINPIIFKQAGDGTDPKNRLEALRLNEWVALLLLVLVGCLGFAAVFWGQSICALLIDQKYSDGFWAFPWIVVSGGIYAVAQQLLTSVYSGTSTHRIIRLRGLAAILSCFCYFSGAYAYGLVGVVYAGFGFSVIFLLLSSASHGYCKKSCRNTGS